jgi:hypothetical protein
VLLRAQAVGSFHTVEHLVGPDRVVRIDPSVPAAGLFRLDQIDENRIRGLAEDVSRRSSPSVKPFTGHVAAAYTPCYTT